MKKLLLSIKDYADLADKKFHFLYRRDNNDMNITNFNCYLNFQPIHN